MTQPFGEVLEAAVASDPATELARLQAVADAPVETDEDAVVNLRAQQAIAELFAQHPSLYRDTQLNQ